MISSWSPRNCNKEEGWYVCCSFQFLLLLLFYLFILGTNDAKCKITIENQNKSTKVSKKSVDPTWDENFKL